MARFSLLVLAALIVTAASSSWHRVAIDAEIVDGLRVGFYDRTCPEAESTVRDIVNSDTNNDATIPAGLIRIFFHDCFVKGCDASILLDETPTPGEEKETEKQSPANGFTLNGLSTIDVAKQTIESLCPRTVSCADIVAFAARDAAVAAGHPGYAVAAGRRDGLASFKSSVNLPGPGQGVADITRVFVEKGMSQEDAVVLSGAHSIGGAHCFMFSDRLYNFSEGADVDPAMDAGYAGQLRNVCPAPGRADEDPENAPKVAFDARTEQRLDSSYYRGLLARRGLLSSDNSLVEDPATRPLVELLARDGVLFHRKFGEAMQKLGMVDVLVGEGNGEIRVDCRAVNSPGEQVTPTLQSEL